MVRLKKIICLQKTQIFMLVFVTLASGIMGSLIMDCIVRFVPDDNMTVFPLGTVTSYAGVLGGTLAAAYFEASNFRNMLSLGASRKAYILQTYLVKIPVMIGCGALCILCYRFEGWKFRTIYPQIPVEPLRLDLSSQRFVAVLLMVSLTVGMLMNILVIRNGMRGGAIMAGLIPILSLSAGTIVGKLVGTLEGTVDPLLLSSRFLYPAGMLFCLFLIVLCLRAILKQGI